MGKMEIFYNTTLPVGDDIKSGRPCTIIHFDKDGEIVRTEDYNLENIKVPDYAYESIARALLPDIVEFFSSEEGKRFAEEIENKKIQKSKHKK